MSELPADVAVAFADLDARIREVETITGLILRILSSTKPLNGVLDRYGATDSQEKAFYRLLDDVAARINASGPDQPTFGYFAGQIRGIFPELRADRDFIGLVIATLKIERPAYRALHQFMVEQDWPGRAAANADFELDHDFVLHVHGTTDAGES